ncbi:MAG: Gx transporter family protein [Clostridia bacterium]|nr:Gx transporter family protein [Clostridia bacterium]
MRRTVKKLTLCALLTALALGLSYVERLIPMGLLIPLPGIKLGLANVVTLFALCFLGPGPAFAVLIARCFLGSLFAGSLSGLVFSLTGGLLAMVVMAAARKGGRLSVYGISVCGAAAHNAGQICAAMAVMKTPAAISYLPVLLVTAVFAGALTGAAAAGVFRAAQAAGFARTWSRETNGKQGGAT